MIVVTTGNGGRCRAATVSAPAMATRAARRPEWRAPWPAAERARQALQHHRLQADAGLSHRVRAVRGVSARLFRLEHAPPDHRADHRARSMPRSPACPSNTPGRHPPARLRHRCARAPAGLEPLSGHHLHRRRAGRQCRLCSATGVLEHTGWTETVYRRLDDAGRHRAPRAGAGVPVAERLPPAGRPRSRGARAALRRHPRGRAMVDRAGDRARSGRRLLRRAPRAAAASMP